MPSLNQDPQGSSLIRLRGLYPSLRTALQKVADLVLRQPEMVIYVSVNAVAAAAGVTKPPSCASAAPWDSRASRTSRSPWPGSW